MEVQEFADDVEDMLAPLLRRDELLDAVGEEDDTNLVVVLDGTERQGGSNLRGHIALGLHNGTEVQTAADIHQEHHRQLALLLKDLDKGLIETRGDVPLDVTDVVAILVLPHLAEGHTASFEGRVVLPRKDIAGESTGLDFNLADALEYLRCFHCLI